jgi:hypothetical protein
MASLLKLRTGTSIPAIGFGTWQVSVVISSLLHAVQTGSGVYTAHYRTHTKCCFAAVDWHKSEADRSLPCTVEVKHNEATLPFPHNFCGVVTK